MKQQFDKYVDQLLQHLTEADRMPSIAPNTVKTFKDTVLLPMLNKQQVDPVKMQEAIRAGVIEDHGDSVYTVSDVALAHVNQDPDLQGKFLPSQQAAADVKRQKVQTQQTRPQTATSSTTPATSTTKSNTNSAGVVSSVYKIPQ